MNQPRTDQVSAPVASNDRLRRLRYVWRVPMLVWHVLIHLPVTMVLITPLGAAIRLPSGERLDQRILRWWQGGLLRVFGFRVQSMGTPNRQATLFVANHCSWLDISLLHSQRALGFVGKAEIAAWPVIGWLATRGGTIYHQRGSKHSLSAVSTVMIERLGRGESVAVFPEGGAVGKVDRVGVFHARIFQVCSDAQVVVQPVALRYVREGRPALWVAFKDGENFFANFLRLLAEPPTIAEAHFLPTITLSAEGRRHLAETARAQIIQALGFADTARSPDQQAGPMRSAPAAAAELAGVDVDAGG